MEIEMPENFPYQTPPKKGEEEDYLVRMKNTGDRKWEVLTIDGVPMGSPGKANAPGDMAEGTPEEEAAESPDEEASEQAAGEGDAEDSQATGAEDMQPQPAGGMDQSTPPTVGSAFSKKVMGG
jgi:hypothetical protein